MDTEQENAVRHHYPVAIRNASIGTAFGLMMKTLPYALVRFGILLLVTIITIIWGVFTFGGGAWLSEKIHGIVGLGWIAIGCGAYGYIWYTMVRYALYMVKCGHIAVLTELITKGEVSSTGDGMFAHGKKVVKDRFTQVNVLFAMDLLVEGVIKAFNKTLDWISSILPVPGMENLVQVVKAIIFSATTYVDETIFSYILARGETNPWRGGADGLIYYCQNVKEVLKSAVWIVILDKVLTVILWFIMLLPALAVVHFTGGATGVWALVIAVLFASNVRSAFLKPLFLIMIMSKYHVMIENQPINLEWDAQLSMATDKFKELKTKAMEWVDDHRGAAPADPEPAAAPDVPAE